MTPLSKIGWKEREEDGMIATWDLPSGPEVVPILSEAERPLFLEVVRKWEYLCLEIGFAHGVSAGWMLAGIYRESGGNERIMSKDGGVGLGQITSPALKGGHSDEELKDPRTNLTIMARYMAELEKRYPGDFPSVAAAYNAGSVRASSQNRWGMVMTTGHVSSEVAAYNYYLTLQAEDLRRAAMLAVAKQFTLHELLSEDATDPQEV